MSATPSLFDDLRKWVENHLDALDDDVWEADEEGILASLRCIVKGELGCTERDDYGDDQWAVLMAVQGKRRVTHGRHCLCSACKQEDWTRITSPCGMHGEGCPAVYAPIEGGYASV
jgi:hypothetical protein